MTNGDHPTNADGVKAPKRQEKPKSAPHTQQQQTKETVRRNDDSKRSG